LIVIPRREKYTNIKRREIKFETYAQYKPFILKYIYLKTKNIHSFINNILYF